MPLPSPRTARCTIPTSRFSGLREERPERPTNGIFVTTSRNGGRRWGDPVAVGGSSEHHHAVRGQALPGDRSLTRVAARGSHPPGPGPGSMSTAPIILTIDRTSSSATRRMVAGRSRRPSACPTAAATRSTATARSRGQCRRSARTGRSISCGPDPTGWSSTARRTAAGRGEPTGSSRRRRAAGTSTWRDWAGTTGCRSRAWIMATGRRGARST